MAINLRRSIFGICGSVVSLSDLGKTIIKMISKTLCEGGPRRHAAAT